jgi:hypothetical protein
MMTAGPATSEEMHVTDEPRNVYAADDPLFVPIWRRGDSESLGAAAFSRHLAAGSRNNTHRTLFCVVPDGITRARAALAKLGDLSAGGFGEGGVLVAGPQGPVRVTIVACPKSAVTAQQWAALVAEVCGVTIVVQLDDVTAIGPEEVRPVLRRVGELMMNGRVGPPAEFN